MRVASSFKSHRGQFDRGLDNAVFRLDVFVALRTPPTKHACRKHWQSQWHTPELLASATPPAALMQVLVDYERELGHPDAEPHAQHVAAIRARLAAGE
ncbi:MAG: hypothetical protein O3A00_09530 [Planctomycetota bacterium]|nr:hypothetical protein [Planctomycetota bacterium]